MEDLEILKAEKARELIEATGESGLEELSKEDLEKVAGGKSFWQHLEHDVRRAAGLVADVATAATAAVSPAAAEVVAEATTSMAGGKLKTQRRQGTVLYPDSRSKT